MHSACTHQITIQIAVGDFGNLLGNHCLYTSALQSYKTALHVLQGKRQWVFVDDWSGITMGI